jgi:hypothetical protein
VTTRKRKDPDYTLNVFHHISEETKKRGILFLVQTTKIFVSFRYEILLADEVGAQSVRLRILGLHTPELLMPNSGPARGWKFYTNLSGLLHVDITKQDKSVSEFDVTIDDHRVLIQNAPKNSFILVSNDPVLLD